VGGRIGAGGPRGTLVNLYDRQVHQLEVLTSKEVNGALVDLVDLQGLVAFCAGDWGSPSPPHAGGAGRRCHLGG
jgi:hypothetical protein